MNKIIDEIYKEWCTIPGKESISFTLALKADALLSELDYYPSYIWNQNGSIVFEYNQPVNKKSLFIIVEQNIVSGKLCEHNHILEEYTYLTVDTVNTVLDRFWE